MSMGVDMRQSDTVVNKLIVAKIPAEITDEVEEPWPIAMLYCTRHTGLLMDQ
jgi:hypothetical protein